MMTLKILGSHDRYSRHLGTTCLGKRVTLAPQHGHDIINHQKCGYNPGGVHDALLWDGCLVTPSSLETVMNANSPSLN